MRFDCSLIAVVLFGQTFHTPGFGDEEDFDVSAGDSSDKHTYGEEMLSEVIYADDDDDDLQFVDSPVEEVEEENIATLFMSCSPGRDTEEEEDEDDSVPLSKVYGVSVVYRSSYLIVTILHTIVQFARSLRKIPMHQ